ncbi:DNase I-like protein [Athelia psychrophila]|uniref:DNase I-like protein n=1 Tax=Athelia psychrophila TaxID=1759441 RepID=A0A166CG09_9AGAM|nr:DNase I-like protein [Fibularhizoctonia sp. CBS 109695]
MRERKIGLLAVQEAHMTDEMADDLNKLFEGRLRIIHSQGSSANAAGVAFAINRDITNADQAIAEEVIPGRAISLTIPWHDNHTLTLLNVYAPNAPSDNSKFWGKLTTHYSAQRHRDHPEIMLGDLNLVEDSIDRIPAHPDNTAATTELQTLRDKIKVIDGWRHTHPDEKDFSFQADATGSQSRIDRIYVSRAVYETAFDWGISDTAIRTDHRLTTVRIAKPNTPESGPGRWAMPAIVIQDKRFLDAAVARGIKLEREIDSLELRSETINAQTLFKQFKVNMKNLGRTAAKRLIPKIKLQIESLQKDRREALNGLDTPWGAG